LHAKDEERLEQEAAGMPAHKIDENMWKSREQMEEILFLLNNSRRPVAVSLALYLCTSYVFSFESLWLSSTCNQLQQKSTAEDTEIASVLDDIETKLKDMLNKLEKFQLKNADNVFDTGWFSCCLFISCDALQPCFCGVLHLSQRLGFYVDAITHPGLLVASCRHTSISATSSTRTGISASCIQTAQQAAL
jgi:hypothetical protein